MKQVSELFIKKRKKNNDTLATMTHPVVRGYPRGFNSLTLVGVT